MDDPDWLVQIYEVSDAGTQAMLVGLLAGTGSLAVEATKNGRACFLVVECSSEDQARSVYRFVASSDPGATLLHSTQAAVVPIPEPGSPLVNLSS